MRRSIPIFALALLAAGVLATTAFAQAQRQARPPQAGQQAQQRAENCGTPDEPKPCPPLPKVNLQTYPGNR